MYKIVFKPCLTIIMMLLMILSANIVRAQTIRVIADMSPPYTYSPTSEKQGYTVDILKYLLEKNGYKMQYNVAPWIRTLESVKTGAANLLLLLPAADAKENNIIIHKNPIGKLLFKFYTVKSNSWVYNGVQSLSGQTLGVVRDYFYPGIDDYIAKNKDNSKLIQVVANDKPTETNIKKLLGERIAVTIDDTLIIEGIARDLGALDKLREAGTLGKPILMYVGISPKSPLASKLAEIIDKGIPEMRKSGELKKILDRYFVKDWENN